MRYVRVGRCGRIEHWHGYRGNPARLRRFSWLQLPLTALTGPGPGQVKPGNHDLVALRHALRSWLG
jgi:hypothetical protein